MLPLYCRILTLLDNLVVEVDASDTGLGTVIPQKIKNYTPVPFSLAISLQLKGIINHIKQCFWFQ